MANRILHIDMDAFYAAIEERDRPGLRGKPVVIGSPPDRRGVVSTANYEARTYGIHSAMPSRTAGKLCPHAVFLPVRMNHYLQVSHQLMTLLESFTPNLEQLSIDEAFLDVGGILRAWGDAVSVAEAIRIRIRQDLRLTASIGVARNKFLAKLASDLDKPDGLTVVPHEDAEVLAFLAPMPIRKLWGVGAVTEARLRDYGIATVGDLQRLDLRTLTGWVGPVLAGHLKQLAEGRDDRPVVLEREAKSLSAETTFDTDVRDVDRLRACLLGLVEQVGFRLRKAGLVCRTVQLKLRYDDFQTMTRQASLPDPACTDRTLLEQGAALFEALPRDRRAVRLIGFGVSGLSAPGDEVRQLDLFAGEADPRRDEEVDRAVDSVRARFGRAAIVRGGQLTPRPTSRNPSSPAGKNPDCTG